MTVRELIILLDYFDDDEISLVINGPVELDLKSVDYYVEGNEKILLFRG